MSCTFEFGITPLPLRMEKELLDTRCEDLASGILSQDDPPLKTLSAACKRVKTIDSSSNSEKDTVSRTIESPTCLGGANMIGHDY